MSSAAWSSRILRLCAFPRFTLVLLAHSCVFGFSRLAHRNNWAVLIDTSRYWYNYRHVANTLSFYRTVRRLGIPDSNIILMLAEDIACSTRNVHPGSVFNDAKHGVNLYGRNVEVDYRGDDTSTENVLRLFTGRHSPLTPRSKRLMSDASSNVFVFMAGHSGSHFVKVQDWEEVTSVDLAHAFNRMRLQGRFNKLFWVADTCQSETLQSDFYTEGILGLGSSGAHENSYSHHVDYDIGVAIIDRFTFFSLSFFENMLSHSNTSIWDWVSNFRFEQLHSRPALRDDLFPADVRQTKLTDFLANNGGFHFRSDLIRVDFSGSARSDAGPHFIQCARPQSFLPCPSMVRVAVPAPSSSTIAEVSDSQRSLGFSSSLMLFGLVASIFQFIS